MRSFYASRSWQNASAPFTVKKRPWMLLTRAVQANTLFNISRCFSVKGFLTAPKGEEKSHYQIYKKLQASGETPEFGGTCEHACQQFSPSASFVSISYLISIHLWMFFCQDLSRHSDIFISEALVGADIIDGTFIGSTRLSNTLLSNWTIIVRENLTN